ncbi:energy-coupling factor ABC transporter ATP-binding protein [Heliophilum fasciatum]|uniref:Energy-coupling factor transport system ATP-binding protein n=1 Tax=Heliophilum fasciatum TaxID=35700 RepID=A0A4R2S036_9FIRM|nr:ATP-binding cassette domain-containing protein [Heliophilum fasciatum]MCW2276957.1 energy-coupling factor transport system ATP-binding protein [Heliophilum fasciatum]TCP68517.1 energy-coupling factor transport system ATP-binding protein [Heliophilum fasciatum]
MDVFPAGHPLLQAQQLKHTFRTGRCALQSVNVTIHAGEMVAIIGRNGAGKTTLTKHFNGLLKPTAGTVLVGGQDTRRVSVAQLARTVSYVFQNPDHQIFHGRLFDEVAFGPRNLGLSGKELDQRVASALDAVNLAAYVDRDPAELSRGQRKRATIASVLAMKTPVLILDEPTSGQDYQESRQIMAILQQLHQQGHTILLITHDMELVQEQAQRVLVLGDGQLLLDGSPDELFRQASLLQIAGLRRPPIIDLQHRLEELGLTASVPTAESLAAALASRIQQGPSVHVDPTPGRNAACP